MLALMTQSFLDIGFGIIWWTTIQTGTALGHGFRYLWNLNLLQTHVEFSKDPLGLRSYVTHG